MLIWAAVEAEVAVVELSLNSDEIIDIVHTNSSIDVPATIVFRQCYSPIEHVVPRVLEFDYDDHRC